MDQDPHSRVSHVLHNPVPLKHTRTHTHTLTLSTSLHTDMLVGGIRPHLYCLPILKAESHRVALLEAATSGSPKFFMGTDSAPHPTTEKLSACGCAGVFTAHAAIELYAEAFDSVGKLDMLDDFVSKFGAAHYGLERNPRMMVLEKKAWDVPKSYDFGDGRTVTPLRAGEKVQWQIVE
jgi:dihydroorotase